jgi:hypothetical protein
MKEIELMIEGDPDPTLGEGGVCRLEPVRGESGVVGCARVVRMTDLHRF